MTIRLANIASRLRNAYVNGVVPPLRDAFDIHDEASAYAVQRLNVDFWRAQGRQISGRKIGLTGKAVQAQLGVGEPDFGVLFADMAIPDGGELLASKMIQPKAEAEIAIVLGCDLSNPNCTPQDVFLAADYAVAAIEIVDSRIADWQISFADTVADNASTGFYVLGSDRRALEGLDLYTCGMVMKRNDEIVAVGAGAACWGGPLNSAAWLIRKLATMGEGLRAGDVILTGTLSSLISLTPGDCIAVTIAGLGSVSFRYVSTR